MTEPATDDTLLIRIEHSDEFFDRAASKLADVDEGQEVRDSRVLSLPDDAALSRVLSETNLALIRTVAETEPGSLRELARELDRDIKNVSEAVNELAELGVLDLEEAGRAKRPRVWYDRIEVDYPIRAPDSDDARLAP